MWLQPQLILKLEKCILFLQLRMRKPDVYISVVILMDKNFHLLPKVKYMNMLDLKQYRNSNGISY